MGPYELKQQVDAPYRVVINEAVDLAKKVWGTDGHKFVNGILDRLAPGSVATKLASDPPMAGNEFSIIRRYFSAIGVPNKGVLLGIGDDCALVVWNLCLASRLTPSWKGAFPRVHGA